ncbi:methyltransferase domain-containing protein [Micromonospora craniellae]|uniref:Methyltransferase domain-containing protein n=2 Tax=Micromonospora craniellae TaxID=2294034 RepID=A0A372FSK9_9ACTN|nr:methyltransferase domain-containing protein [Micromonospora craniellae]RFS43731.1 methyltransferase domain-containing protein [Micromonospora craniellae]
MDDLARVLFGHAAFQYLNAACELGLLDLLLDDPKLTKPEIDLRLGLDERANDILLLGCTALGITKKSDGRYETAQVLTDMQEGGDLQRLKDTVAFEQYIVYEGQLDFTESLRRNRNVGLRRVRGTGANLYHRLSENPELERVFYTYMRSWSELANRELTRELDLSGAKHLLDCGGGDAVNAIALAKANPHLQVTVMEIPATARITKRRIADEGLSGQIDVVAGDMFNDPFPSQCDVILFAHQMVIWTLEENTHLMRRAYQALPDGGQLVITNSMSNDEGDGPTVAALDSVYFASLPSEGGMIYSWEQHENCMREAGFKNIRRKQFSGWTPHGMITGQRS